MQYKLNIYHKRTTVRPTHYRQYNIVLKFLSSSLSDGTVDHTWNVLITCGTVE